MKNTIQYGNNRVTVALTELTAWRNIVNNRIKYGHKRAKDLNVEAKVYESVVSVDIGLGVVVGSLSSTTKSGLKYSKTCDYRPPLGASKSGL